jgi:hypothetical protein
MVRGCKAFLTALVVLAGGSVAFAQEATIGAGKLEIGGFPGGGTFFIAGDKNLEPDWSVYTAGGDLTYYITSKAAVEGEFTGSIGWAQDINYKNTKVIHSQMPGVWSYMGNIVLFPGGTTGKRVPFYITGGAGLLSLQPRIPDAQFGYGTGAQCPCPGWQTFGTEDIGAGLKIFRAADAPNWGFRIDYRMLFVNSKSSAPAFFAQSKSRRAHRVYIGMLYTWKR